MWVSCDLCSQSSHLLRFLSAVAPRTRQRVYRIKQDSAARQQLLKSRKNQMLILPIQARARKPGKNHGADIIRFLFRGAKRFPLTGGNLPRPTPHAPTGRFSELVEETRLQSQTRYSKSRQEGHSAEQKMTRDGRRGRDKMEKGGPSGRPGPGGVGDRGRLLKLRDF